jgi:hypothetical protein
MTYKLKTEPELVYFMETKQCTIEDENGVEHEIRISEHSNGTDFLILDDSGWQDITDRELIDYIMEDLPFEEIENDTTGGI